MTNETDVRWLDEPGLHGAVLAKDPEAFAELMRRYDPVVRAHMARIAQADRVDEEVAGFWIGLMSGDWLRGWEPELGGLLAQWIGVLAAQACAARLREERRAA